MTHGKVSPRILLSAVALYVLLAVVIRRYCLDNDTWFLLSTGRYLVEGGFDFPATNPWLSYSAHFCGHLPIVVQQWGWTVMMYAAYSAAGRIGLWALTCVTAAVCGALMTRLILARHGNAAIAYLFPPVAIYLSRYLLTDRPEGVTVILLLLQCLLIERGARRPVRYALGHIAIVIAEANLHAATLPVHILVWAAYLVKEPKTQKDFDTALRTVAPAMVLSTLAGLINPYTYRGALYGVMSLVYMHGSGVGTAEMNPPALQSIPVAVLVVAWLILGVRLYRDRALQNTTLNMALGMTAMVVVSTKYTLLLPLFLAYVVSEIKLPEISAERISRWGKTAAVLPSVIILGAAAAVFPTTDLTAPFETEWKEAAECMDPNSKVFANYIGNGYLEWEGFDKLYLDERAELFTELTGSDRLARMLSLDSIDETEEFLNDGDFDYVMLTESEGNENITMAMYLKEKYPESVIYESEYGGYAVQVFDVRDITFGEGN